METCSSLTRVTTVFARSVGIGYGHNFSSLFVTRSFCLFVCVMCCNQVDTSGTIWAFVGDGGEGRRGDGGPATAASLSLPLGLALSTSGVMYVADFGNNVIRMVRMLVL